MTKNTKIVIALATLAGLFIAYKKGVFGGSSEDTTDNTPAEPKTTAKEAAKDVSTSAAAPSSATPSYVKQSSVETPQVAVVSSGGESVIKTNSPNIVTATGAANPFFTTSF